MSAHPVSVSIYIDQGCWAGAVLLIKELLTVAGPLQQRNPDLLGAASYDVTLVGPSLRPVRSFTGPMLAPQRSVRTAPPAQVIVLPAFYMEDGARPTLSPALRRWLHSSYATGACLVGITSGVRLLAETGLLDGRDATGNMSDRRAFAQHYPAVRFAPQTPLLVDGRLITAASIGPAIDACVHLVSRFQGEKAALKFARYTNSARQLSYQQAALNINSRHAHDDARVEQAQRYIELHCTSGVGPKTSPAT